MKVYLDLVFFINFFFDFLILYTTKLVLKETTSCKRIVLGSLFGSLTIFLLFLSLSNFCLLLFKLAISVVIILITFGRANFFSDFLYFYLISMILGGFLYLLDINFTYESQGALFYGTGLGLNLLAVLALTPVFLYFYIKNYKNNKAHSSLLYIVQIYKDQKVYYLKGMLDTGNQLKDPTTGKCVILINSKVDIPVSHCFYVPYKALNTEGVILCSKVDRVVIDNVEFSKCLIGFSKTSFSLGGVDCILPSIFKEEL